METKEATHKCGTCHKDVADSNFALHETHCRRFLCLCPDCGENVPRDQLDQHRQQQHTQVRCSKCFQKMERCLLMDHEVDQCVERLQSCVFCQLEMPWKHLDQHTDVCGSRTELCMDCGRYVTLRDQSEHSTACSGPAPAARAPPSKSSHPVSSVRRPQSPPEDEVQNELEDLPGSRFQVPGSRWDWSDPEDEDVVSVGPTRTPRGPSLLSDHLSRGLHGDGDELGTCPLCHVTLPVVTLRWHQVKCQIHVHMNRLHI